MSMVTTRPGYRRPTRLVTWVYSDVDGGRPMTTMTPTRLRSTPPEILAGARVQSSAVEPAAECETLTARLAVCCRRHRRYRAFTRL